MWTKQLTIRKSAADTDVASYKLFRNSVLALEGQWPAGAEEVVVQDTLSEDGDYAWHAILSDAVGNVSGASAPLADHLDHLAPAVTLDPLPAQVLNTGVFQIGASAVDNLGNPLQLRCEFNGVQVGDVVDGAFGLWEASVVGLTPSVYTVRVYARDQSGLEGEASASVEVIQQPADITISARVGLILDINGQRITT